MEGMDKDYNTNAADRHVVIHGADYVSDDFIKQHGYLGRSQGCPLCPWLPTPKLLKTVKDRTCLFLNASEANLESEYLNTESAMEAYFATASTNVPYHGQTAAL
jgi:hypothetical protein